MVQVLSMDKTTLFLIRHGSDFTDFDFDEEIEGYNYKVGE